MEKSVCTHRYVFDVYISTVGYKLISRITSDTICCQDISTAVACNGNRAAFFHIDTSVSPQAIFTIRKEQQTVISIHLDGDIRPVEYLY